MNGKGSMATAQRHVALLRGVSPMNCRMADLKACFEAAGFQDVVTVRSSGNIAFTAPRSSRERLQSLAEEAMQAHLGRVFPTFVRSSATLRRLLRQAPFTDRDLAGPATAMISFLHRPADTTISLPLPRGDSALVAVAGREIYSLQRADAQGAAFAAQLERAFAKQITTRTLGTVRLCAEA